MIDVMDVAAEQRWTAWRLEGARLNAIWANRMQIVFIVAGLAPVLWLIWRL